MLLEEQKKKIKDIFRLIDFKVTLEDLKRIYVEFVLESHDWNRTHAAKSLGVPIRTLREWYLRKKSIEIPEHKQWKKSNFGKK